MKKFLITITFSLFMLICKSQTNPSKPQSVLVRGEKMHYVEKGTGEPVIMVHGAIGDFNAWSFQMDTLANNYRAIAISRRYAQPNKQPKSNDTFDCTVAYHAQDLAAFMKAMDIPKAHLIGHSYGAMIILRFAIDHPEMVKSLVLGEPGVESVISGTVVGDAMISDFRANSNLAVKFYRDGDEEASLRQFMITVLGSDELYDVATPEFLDGLFQNLVEGICIAATQDLSSISKNELSNIQIPTLLVKGELTIPYLAAPMDSLNVIVPHSTLVELTQTNHALQGQNPVEFNKAVIDFLANVNPK
ncbi:alpha/beta fold hydrolase [Allomuricauda sp. NBRC 101325]|uniref:alpha/beta fold hydrolase n=1 Tax=Allomuricauda sp. NBRC 101325 TaxID=1113758 RepID=UPI00249FA4DE|nr:alpha/beta hydrolase [Muricauda sp. NBRC 101325]GLU44402.1 alpha/beta hydrolase [Muricauda sp. NBRC 101325]